MRWAPDNYSALTHQVVQEADGPLAFPEIFAAVNARRLVTTRNPKGTIRNAIGQNPLIVSLGNGRYGYLPALITGAVTRVRLSNLRVLEFPDEAVMCLWPGGAGTWGRGDGRPVTLSLPDGTSMTVTPSFVSPGRWGAVIGGALQAYLAVQEARPDDWLIFRVTDGTRGLVECRFEAAAATDCAALAGRNRALVAAAEAVIQWQGGVDVLLHVVVRSLIAQGSFQSDFPPSPFIEALRGDSRFVELAPFAWGLKRLMSDRQRAASVQRWAPMTGLLEGVARNPGDHMFFDGLPETLSRARTESIANTLLGLTQGLVYDAWEAKTRSHRVHLAKRAIGLSADCTDAYRILAEDEVKDPDAALKLYEQALAAGERWRGPQKFAELVGQFWDALESRPYMRARFALAAHLWLIDRRREAVAHVWEMLRLNPSDNQGVRYVLLGWLLDLGDNAGARRLLDSYQSDAAATWMYGEALTRFRTEGDSAAARAALRVACLDRPLVPDYLAGRRKLPRALPEFIEMGGESEAVDTAHALRAAWHATPGAVA